MADVVQLEPLRREARLECGQRRARSAVEERRAVVGLDEVDADRMLAAGEVEVDRAQRGHDASPLLTRVLRRAPVTVA